MNYDLLLSFGCSFTEGGGLNDPRYHDYIKSGLTAQFDRDRMNEFMTEHSYPGYLSRLLNCEFKNFGTSCASNDFIFQKTYQECSKYINSNKKILVTVQTSMMSRILLYSADDNNFELNVNSDQHNTDVVNSYFRTFIQRFFNPEKEFKKVLMMTDLMQNWLSGVGIDFAFVAWESVGTLPEKYFLSFPGLNGSIGSYADKEKLLIADLPNITFMDRHLSKESNELLANKIFEYIKDKYD